MMRQIVLTSLQALVLLFLIRTATAQKYNLTGSIKATLVAGNEPPGVACDNLGICTAVNQTIPPRHLWYWCGFKTTHRTIYNVTSFSSQNPNITAMYMMRQNVLEDCALKNVTFVAENCAPIPESQCSSKPSCNVRLFGLVFADDACLVIINNKGRDLLVSVKLNNFFDRPRYYGTVFVLFFTVVGGLAVISNVAWQFYTIIIAPVNRHHEPIKVKREDPIKDMESNSSSATGGGAATASRTAWFQSATGWYQKIMTRLRPMQGQGHKA